MEDIRSPLNGHDLRDSQPKVRREVRASRWLVPIGIVIVVMILALLLTGCGSWLNDTRTGLEAANGALNGYDDVAVVMWQDAPTNAEARADLGISTCASLIVQDSVIQAWSITTAVDKGLAKETDITPYIGAAITVLDSLEDYLEMAGVPIPSAVKVGISALEGINPGGYIPPDEDPLEQCTAVLQEHFPSAGLSSIPWDTIITVGAEFALFMADIIQRNLAGEDVPEDALETYLRHPLKQAVLYERAIADAGDGG